MSLYVEAAKRGMPERLTDDEEATWWYQRDMEHLAVVVRQRAEIDRLQALATMMADAFGDWEEPTHDGTREWCSRFQTYLRGNVVALATYTEDEWSKVMALREAAEAAEEER